MGQNWHWEGCCLQLGAIRLDVFSAGELLPGSTMAHPEWSCQALRLEFAKFWQLCPLRKKLSCCHQKDSKQRPRHLVYVHPHDHAQDRYGQPKRRGESKIERKMSVTVQLKFWWTGSRSHIRLMHVWDIHLCGEKRRQQMHVTLDQGLYTQSAHFKVTPSVANQASKDSYVK